MREPPIPSRPYNLRRVGAPTAQSSGSIDVFNPKTKRLCIAFAII